jgi:hypothetical protein
MVSRSDRGDIVEGSIPQKEGTATDEVGDGAGWGVGAFDVQQYEVGGSADG